MSDEISVDVLTTKKFTKQHLNVSKKLVIKEAFPEFYGEELPKTAKHISRQLVDMKDVYWESEFENTQMARKGGGNPKYKEIKQDIVEYGFKLKHPPVALRLLPDGCLVRLNGRTRTGILSDLGIKNLIADIYSVDTESDASVFGLRANSNHDPAGDLSLEDVFNECVYAIQMGWIKHDILEISARINQCAGKGCFSKAKRETLAYRIYNQFEDKVFGTILAWNKTSDVKRWMGRNGFYNIPKKQVVFQTTKEKDVLYYVISSEYVYKAVSTASHLAVEYPGKEVRVIVHTGILTGSDITQCYIKRLQEFSSKWNFQMKSLSQAYFGGVPSNNNKVKLYGALPAISSLHDLNKMVVFGQNSSYIQPTTIFSMQELIDNLDEKEYTVDEEIFLNKGKQHETV